MNGFIRNYMPFALAVQLLAGGAKVCPKPAVPVQPKVGMPLASDQPKAKSGSGDHFTGNHKEDYPLRGVEAARRVLTEFWQVLGEYREIMVIIGGWVPALQLPNAIPPHMGSLDVDVLLDPDPQKVRDRSDGLLLLLKERGFHEADKPYRLAKSVQIDGGDPIRVEVDFLLPMESGSAHGNSPSEFRAIEAEMVRFALHHYQPVVFHGRMPDGRNNTITLRVVSLPAFIVLKAIALDQRDKAKDAYDIYYCLKNAPEGPKGLARALLPDREAPEVGKALEILQSKFSGPDDYGPSSLVLFLNPQDPLERRFLAQDAHALMKLFLDEITHTPQTADHSILP